MIVATPIHKFVSLPHVHGNCRSARLDSTALPRHVVANCWKERLIVSVIAKTHRGKKIMMQDPMAVLFNIQDIASLDLE
jgi:hypothetical protein